MLVLGVGVLMLILLEGGVGWPWLSWDSSALREGKVPEPIIPLWVFKDRLILFAGLASFLNGAIVIGYSAMVPTHVQGVLGRSVLIAGMTLAGMSIGWPLASFASGAMMARMGYRKTAILGAMIVLLGASAVLMAAPVSAFALGFAVFVVGLGLGFQSNAYIITIQSAVEWKQRGVATANNIFMRTLGSSVGVAAFGGILNSTVSGYLQRAPISVADRSSSLSLVNRLLDPSQSGLLGNDRVVLIQALSQGMLTVFSFMIVAAMIGIGLAWQLPRQFERR